MKYTKYEIWVRASVPFDSSVTCNERGLPQFQPQNDEASGVLLWLNNHAPSVCLEDYVARHNIP